MNWSTGGRKRIVPGDRVFLLRQGVDPKGVMASGEVTSEPYADMTWDEASAGTALYVDVRFDAMFDPDVDGVLPRSELEAEPLAVVHWDTQRGGIEIDSTAAPTLENTWRTFCRERELSSVAPPEEIVAPQRYVEGATQRIAVNVYERDRRARQACIERHGTACSVCGFAFADVYGALGRDYIHVHHLVPLAEIGQRYEVDPARDLRPVCANCHAMLHRPAEVLGIDELRDLVGLAPRDRDGAAQKHEYSRAPKKCPECGSDRVARILWGMVLPDKALREEMDAGQVVLGGCVVSDYDPSWRCMDCGASMYRKGGRRAAP
jgi:5-methylcytosine-specific restriction protein A